MTNKGKRIIQFTFGVLGISGFICSYLSYKSNDLPIATIMLLSVALVFTLISIFVIFVKPKKEGKP